MWKDIPGYEGKYQAHPDGKIRTLNLHQQKGNIKELCYSESKDGYYRCNLSLKGMVKTFQVHRLIAITFIPEEEGKVQVNHKDLNVKNNRVDNIEWISHSYNLKHYYRTSGKAHHLLGKKWRVHNGKRIYKVSTS